jgi:hypothetical protein
VRVTATPLQAVHHRRTIVISAAPQFHQDADREELDVPESRKHASETPCFERAASVARPSLALAI